MGRQRSVLARRFSSGKCNPIRQRSASLVSEREGNREKEINPMKGRGPRHLRLLAPPRRAGRIGSGICSGAASLLPSHQRSVGSRVCLLVLKCSATPTAPGLTPARTACAAPCAKSAAGQIKHPRTPAAQVSGGGGKESAHVRGRFLVRLESRGGDGDL